MENYTVKIQTGKVKEGKNKGQDWYGVRIEIGSWSTLVFPKSKFEMDYIKDQLAFSA